MELWAGFTRKTVFRRLTIMPCAFCFPPFTAKMQQCSGRRHVPCNVSKCFSPLNCRFESSSASNNQMTAIHGSLTRDQNGIFRVDMATTCSHATYIYIYIGGGGGPAKGYTHHPLNCIKMVRPLPKKKLLIRRT